MVTSRPLNDIVQHFEDKTNEVYCDECKKTDPRYQFQCIDCTEASNDSWSFDLCPSCYEQGERCGNKGHTFVKQFNSDFIEIEAVEEDLINYVQWRIASSDFLQRCVEIKDGLMEDILDAVAKGSRGMFLLAKFNMDTLASKLRPGEVVSALKRGTLPQQFDGIYTAALERIQDLPSRHMEVVMDFLDGLSSPKDHCKLERLSMLSLYPIMTLILTPTGSSERRF